MVKAPRSHSSEADARPDGSKGGRAKVSRKKRSARRKRLEYLMRRIDITAVSLSVQLGTQAEGGSEPELHNYGSIELTGTMDEPVRDTRDVHIVLYSTDDSRVGRDASIGHVNGIKPVMHPALFLPQRDFNRVWTLALSGLLKHAHLVMTPPRYHTASVLSLSFSTHPEE